MKTAGQLQRILNVDMDVLSNLQRRGTISYPL